MSQAASRFVLRSALLGSPIAVPRQPVCEEAGGSTSPHVIGSRVPTIAEALECIPEPCRNLAELVIEQQRSGVSGVAYIRDREQLLSKRGLASAKAILLTLIPEFSAENTLPRCVISKLVTLLEQHQSPSVKFRKSDVEEARKTVGDYAPEISDLLTELYCGSIASIAIVKRFLVGLCQFIMRQVRAVVEPPPWEPIPGTYNPPARGETFCF